MHLLFYTSMLNSTAPVFFLCYGMVRLALVVKRVCRNEKMQATGSEAPPPPYCTGVEGMKEKLVEGAKKRIKAF